MQQSAGFQMLAPTYMVKRLIIINVAVWLVLQLILERFIFDVPYITIYFSLIPKTVIEGFYFWQFFTYMFLHALSPMHLLVNMLSLYFCGTELEQNWGRRFFLMYYLICGVGAGLFYVFAVSMVGLIQGHAPSVYEQPVIGASGAIFGILLAYGVIYGERFIYFFGAFPIKGKFFVMIIGAMEVINLVGSGLNGSVANLAHLGGLVAGGIFLFTYTRWKQIEGRRGGKPRRNLKLVVNKDRPSDDGPKYWN